MRELEESLLRWYRRHRRRLPWRESPDPYRVWVSELMLQQTQVKTVLPYFQRFMERFPDVFALAAAEEQAVLAAWSGLGYYRRAKALHRAARMVVTELQGRFPDSGEGWLRLPGVGRYTVGAIMSIAYGARAPILDGNVARLLSRLFLVRGDPRSGPANKALWKLAENILPRERVSDFNQALMELGALVCTPRNPRCLVCPLQRMCGAYRQGVTEELPELAPRPQSVPVTMAAAVVRRRGKFLVYRRDDEELMRDLWELPGGACEPGEDPGAALAREAREVYGLEIEPLGAPARVRHSIMNRRITLWAFSARLKDQKLKIGRDHAWVDREGLSRYPVSSLTLKALKSLE